MGVSNGIRHFSRRYPGRDFKVSIEYDVTLARIIFRVIGAPHEFCSWAQKGAYDVFGRAEPMTYSYLQPRRFRLASIQARSQVPEAISDLVLVSAACLASPATITASASA